MKYGITFYYSIGDKIKNIFGEVFEADSPEKALKKAIKHFNNPNFDTIKIWKV